MSGITPARLFGFEVFESVTAIARAGLRIELLREHPVCDFEHLRGMHRDEDGYWRLGEAMPRVPHTYSLVATR
jgi:hypothetical protein